MSQFSKKWIVLLVLVIPMVFVSQARAQATPGPSSCRWTGQAGTCSGCNCSGGPCHLYVCRGFTNPEVGDGYCPTGHGCDNTTGGYSSDLTDLLKAEHPGHDHTPLVTDSRFWCTTTQVDTCVGDSYFVLWIGDGGKWCYDFFSRKNETCDHSCAPGIDSPRNLDWDCSVPPSPTPTNTPTNTPSPSPTPVEIAISGRIYCQDPGSSTSYPIEGAWLLFKYHTDMPVVYNLQSDANGNFSTVMINPDQGIPFELKHPRLDASGNLSNGQPYSSLIGPTGNNINGCSFVGETTDSDPVYTCNIKPYNNLDFKYTNCEPQVLYPQCQDIEARNVENPLGSAIPPEDIDEYVHQQVQFACLSDYPDLVSRYEFRVIKKSSDASLEPEIIPLEVADPNNPDYKNISAPYTIDRGQYAVQCRICTEVELGEEVCQPWDWNGNTIPWPEVPAPTSVPLSPTLGAQKCLPSDCGKQEFQCVATHSLQCQLDPLGECSWQCIPIDKTEVDAT